MKRIDGLVIMLTSVIANKVKNQCVELSDIHHALRSVNVRVEFREGKAVFSEIDKKIPISVIKQRTLQVPAKVDNAQSLKTWIKERIKVLFNETLLYRC